MAQEQNKTRLKGRDHGNTVVFHNGKKYMTYSFINDQEYKHLKNGSRGILTMSTLYRRVISFLLIPSLFFHFPVLAKSDDLEERKSLFERMESLTQVPWHYLAAIDQFERSIRKPNQTGKKRLLSIRIPASKWTGLLNPDDKDSNPTSISFFSGIGKDGNGDGMASMDDDLDQLYSFAHYLSQYGTTVEDIRIGLWEYYHDQKTVQVIDHIAQIINKYQSLDLNKKVFPIPRQYDYSYRPSWGDPRGWGGKRIHEGNDIFAGYGTPVRSTCYGYVEVMGWNNYGGWRVGIRDINNVYHYYAHLSGYNKKFKVGSIVEPGTVIGYVGSSGYGKPGTSGRFVPHLHFGMYIYNGRVEWAFDPYPFLRQWERNKN